MSLKFLKEIKRPIIFTFFCVVIVLVFGCTTFCLTDRKHVVQIPESPCLIPHKGFDFVLCKDFTFYVNFREYIVPELFSSDLASIPRVLWSIHSPTQVNTIAPAIIHDYLYYCPNDMSRLEADKIFFEALLTAGVSTRQAVRYWLAVRLFGNTQFNHNKDCPL